MTTPQQLVDAVGSVQLSKNTFTCQYCKKSFQRESTLLAHSCEKKRRWQNKDSQDVLVGFASYDLFYRIEMQSKPKEYKDFVDSQYYTAFVKFGAYCLNTKVIDQEQFTRWLIKNKAKLKDWPTDKMYLLFVQDHVKRESVERALERFVEHASATEYFETFWESASGYLIADWVEMGKISPWLLISSNRAQTALETMPAECMTRIANCIDADYWGKKRQLNPHDANFVEEMIDGK
tara:strand:- start:2328 stop:3032 length:705 start_codon:yes stop_codon:yes gene_type:complete